MESHPSLPNKTTRPTVLGQSRGKTEARSLQALKDCAIVVDDLNEDATRGGLNERNLRREVAAKLSAIGIHTGNAPSLSSPFLRVSVLVTRLPNAGYVFAVALELRELVVPERDKDKEANQRGRSRSECTDIAGYGQTLRTA